MTQLPATTNGGRAMPTSTVSREVREIEVGKLKVRSIYQRPLDERRVKKMTDAFDENLIGALEVSFADGQFWVVDGQHRLALLRAKGIKTVNAVIHYGLSLEEEANLFGRLNSQRRPV